MKYKYWIILMAIIGGAILVDQTQQSSPSVAASTAQSDDSDRFVPISEQGAHAIGLIKDETNSKLPTEKEVSQNYQPIPINQGIHQRYTDTELVGPFQIITPSGTEKYYVKLVDAVTGTTVMTLFIYGGQTFDTEVPLGTYRVKYATGDVWYGEDHLFGPNTAYSEADKTFEFAMQENQVSGYTVRLIRQQNGNLRTKRISANQF